MVIALQFLLSLSILVVLHEFGHFLPAKAFKTRVEKFYLFFNPWFSLFKFKKGETEYGIGWLPLGGFVKISGMIDESMDTEQMKQPAQPWEFRSKPAWQRLIIMVGGVVVNLILGFVIYTMVLFTWGREILPLENVTNGVSVHQQLLGYGFQDGDHIVALNDATPDNFFNVNKMLLLDDIEKITVNRDGDLIDLALPADFGQLMIDSGIKQAFGLRIPNIIDSIPSDSPALEAGFLKGDLIYAVNGTETPFFDLFINEAQKAKGEQVTITVVRDGGKLDIETTLNDQGQIGFIPKGPKSYFETKRLQYTFLESVPAGMLRAKETLTDYVVSMKFLFSKAGASQVGGFVTIAKIFPSTWNWEIFWLNTAFLSLILAFMNILPIPALDGGHVMFLVFEMISGRPPSQKFMEYAQIVGIVLLLSLLIFANGNDIFKLFSN